MYGNELDTGFKALNESVHLCITTDRRIGKRQEWMGHKDNYK